MRDKIFDTKTETPKQRSLRMKKNRLIRKQKLYGTPFINQEPQSKQINSNNRQEKHYVQKLKNRQAAQKSRQQKKLYVTQLQEEIKFLKQKLYTLSHCEKCQKQLQISAAQLELSFTTQSMTIQSSPSQHQTEPETFVQEEDESEFVRMSSTDENSSIGIYLFVFMIMLGVFCIGNRMDVSDTRAPLRRDLTQSFTVQQAHTPSHNLILQTPFRYEMNMKSTYTTLDQSDLGPQSYKNGLLSMDQVRSPSLISDEKYFERIITSFQNYKLNEYDDKNLRSKVGLVDANKSLMFCNRPKIYRSNQNGQGVFSSFIDIFVKGAEIMSIFPQSQSQLASPSNFQLDGLYKITASVQEIEQISNPNFIY